MTFPDLGYAHHIVEDGFGGRIPTPPPLDQALLDALGRGFHPRDGDVVAITYPKAGTAWLRQILHLLTSGGRQGPSSVDAYVPYLEGTDLPAIDDVQAFVAALADRPAPRVFVTHLPYALLPGSTEARARFIYLARDPKDCAVSFFHFMNRAADEAAVGPWDRFFDLFLRGRVYYGPIFEHVHRWWQASREQENVLFITYEGLKRDLPGSVARIARFIGVEAHAGLVEAVVEQSRFSAMRRNPRALPTRTSAFHLRKGAVGDWQNTFTPEQAAALDARCDEVWSETELRRLFEP